MTRSFRVLFPIVLAVVYMGCKAPESSEPAPVAASEPQPAASAPETGPDAVTVDASHYTVVEENDRVRVLRIAYPAGESSVMHYHPDSVAVFLTDHHVQFELPDGSKADAVSKGRETMFTPAGQHLPTNVGEAPVELILVELKAAAAAAASGGEKATGPDPTAVDPDHYSVAFENDKVRVIRIKYGAGESSVMHFHPDSVAVFFDEVKGQFELPDGSTRDITVQAGQAMYAPAGQHRPTNKAETPFELIQIELK